ncbi:MAG: hypothetical protein LUG85_04025 [Clostridiales bacterium]|nr:hypothetical protein [Clostridiales bacterium]
MAQQILADDGDDEEDEDEDEDDDDELSASDAENEDESKKKKGKSIRNIILIVIIVILFVVTACMIGYLIHTNSSSSIYSEEIAMSTGDVDSTVGEFVYWYTYTESIYSYYGYTLTDDEVQSYTIEQMAYIDALYGKALEAGYELDDDDNAEIEAELASYEEYAESYSMTVDEFIEENCGTGVTVDTMRRIIEKQLLAQKYYNDEMDALDGTITEDAVEAEYAADMTAYDLIDVSYYYFDASEDASADYAAAIVAAVEAGSDFQAAVDSVMGDDSQDVVDLQGYSYSSIASNFSDDVADWIYAADDSGEYTSVAGSVYLYESDSAIYVIYVNNVPERDESYSVYVDYIAVAVNTDDELKTEDEMKLEAKSKANSILEEFLSGNTQDEDTFLTLASDKTYEDSDLSYDDYYSGDGAIDIIDEWGSAEGRAAGDCEVVESDDVYYVFYYVGKDEQPVWYQTIADTLLETAQTEWTDSFTSSYEDSITTNDDIIANAVSVLSADA